jgi:hypothetical protein
MEEDEWSLMEDASVQRKWIRIGAEARSNISYVGGEVYNTKTALIPEDKKYLAQLDSHLIFTDIGSGF